MRNGRPVRVVKTKARGIKRRKRKRPLENVCGRWKKNCSRKNVLRHVKRKKKTSRKVSPEGEQVQRYKKKGWGKIKTREPDTKETARREDEVKECKKDKERKRERKEKT